MRCVLPFLLATSFVAASSGCGQSSPADAAKQPQAINASQVIAAFTRAGVPLHHWGFFDSVDQYSDEATLAHLTHETSPPLSIEIFPTLRQAQLAFEVGGNIEDDAGKPIRPLARIANVVITLDKAASASLHRKVLSAVASLRRTANG